MTFEMKLNEAPFELIKNKIKTIELRLYDEKRQMISIGDLIIFTKRGAEDTVSARVVAIHRFPSFKELYSALPLDLCGYLPSEIEEASYTDMEIYYSKEDIARFGVVGIEIELSDTVLND